MRLVTFSPRPHGPQHVGLLRDADQVIDLKRVGGTPPFGYPEPVRAFLDPVLLSFEEVWAAAGTPDSVFRTTPEELRRTTNAEVADFRESSSRR